MIYKTDKDRKPLRMMTDRELVVASAHEIRNALTPAISAAQHAVKPEVTLELVSRGIERLAKWADDLAEHANATEPDTAYNTAPTADDLALARSMFDAYGDHADWKAWDGRPMPQWSEVNDAVRSHWVASAQRAASFARPRVEELAARFRDVTSWWCGVPGEEYIIPVAADTAYEAARKFYAETKRAGRCVVRVATDRHCTLFTDHDISISSDNT